MQLKPEEISKLIKEQIKTYENKVTQSDTGTIIMIGDGIARVSGLDNCMANELVRFPNGEYGMALNLEENSVAIVMLGSDEGIKEGDVVERTGKVVSAVSYRSIRQRPFQIHNPAESVHGCRIECRHIPCDFRTKNPICTIPKILLPRSRTAPLILKTSTSNIPLKRKSLLFPISICTSIRV